VSVAASLAYCYAQQYSSEVLYLIFCLANEHGVIVAAGTWLRIGRVH